MKYMREGMNNKILLGSIIAVVILVLVSSSSAVVTKKDDNKSETLDNGRVEIYSKINGLSEFQHYKGIIFKRQVTIYGWLDIEAHTLNPSEPVYYATTSQYLYAPLFIGVFYPIAPGAFGVSGFALGNIKWS